MIQAGMQDAAFLKEALLELKTAPGETFTIVTEQLTGVTLSKILKSLGTASFQGKSKDRVRNALESYLKNNIPDIKYPEKLQ